MANGCSESVDIQDEEEHRDGKHKALKLLVGEGWYIINSPHIVTNTAVSYRVVLVQIFMHTWRQDSFSQLIHQAYAKFIIGSPPCRNIPKSVCSNGLGSKNNYYCIFCYKLKLKMKIKIKLLIGEIIQNSSCFFTHGHLFTTFYDFFFQIK